MKQQALIAALKATVLSSRLKTPFCLKEEVIAAYVDGASKDSQRDRIERHLSDCDACLSRVCLLSRLANDTENLPATVTQLDDARRLVAHRSQPRQGRQVYWATAASVLLAGFIAVTWLTFDDSQHPPERRASAPSIASPVILSPQDGDQVRSDKFVVRWTEVPGSVHYRVRLVSDSGDQISEIQLTDTEWNATESLVLVPGAEYFVRVDAYLPDAKTISSGHHAFTVVDP